MLVMVAADWKVYSFIRLPHFNTGVELFSPALNTFISPTAGNNGVAMSHGRRNGMTSPNGGSHGRRNITDGRGEQTLKY